MTFEGKQIGRYHVVRLLGRGAMGEVYLAEDERIGQQVAIKVIRSELSPFNDVALVREEERLFEREARAIAKLDHPHILPLYDYGETQMNGAHLTYLVMPYRPDGSLSDWLSQRSSSVLLPPREIAHIVGQTADALQHAHNRDVIHQDIKLSNLLVRERADRTFLVDVFLTDFGVARLSSGTAAASQAVRGTPNAMAPEQWEGHAVPASDQYGLAVMTYELLTGRPPFHGNLRRVMYQHLNEAPPPPSAFDRRIPPEVDAVLLRALAKKPSDRFSSVSAFAIAFRQVALSNASSLLTPMPVDEGMATYIQPSFAHDIGKVYTMHQGPGSTGSLIRATLAISAEEAIRGTSRTILLAGGKQVLVQVPPNAFEGQVIAVPESALLITLSIVQSASSSGAMPMLGSGTGSAPQAAVRLASDRVTPLPPVANPYTPLPPVAPNPYTPLPPVAPNPSTPFPPIAQGPQTPLPSTGLYQPPQSYTSLNGATTAGQRVLVTPAPRRSSRRLLLAGLLAGATVVVAGGGIGIYELLGNHTASSAGGTPRGTATAPAASIPKPLGTTLYTYKGHKDFVYVVRWSPDGTRIASGGDDMTVQVWDAFTGQNPLSFHGHKSDVYGIAWSPNGTLIASGSRDGTVQTWNVVTGGVLQVYRGHTNWVNTVDWSPDGTQIASGSTDKTLQIWNANSGVTNVKHPAQPTSQSPVVQNVAWAHKGDRIAAGDSDNKVLVWGLASSTLPLVSYTYHTKEVRCVAWSPNDDRIASGSFDGTVRVWESATGKPLLTYKEHTFNVNDVAWSSDGKYILSASSDNTVKIWEAATGATYFTYTGHTGQVQNARWSPDNRSVASGGYDFTVKVWSTGFK